MLVSSAVFSRYFNLQHLDTERKETKKDMVIHGHQSWGEPNYNKSRFIKIEFPGVRGRLRVPSELNKN